MAIIDDSYFEGILSLDTSKAASKEKLLEYVDYIEEFYMRKLLGQKYYDFSATEKPTWYESFIEKSVFESDGVKYTNDVKTMIAGFTYFEFVKDQTDFNTPVGAQKPNMGNSTSVIPIQKLVRAYNMSVDLYKNAAIYCTEKEIWSQSETIEKINEFGL